MMKVAVTLALLGICLVAANPTAVGNGDAQEMINNRTFDVIVDIRSHREFKRGHIKGAINMPSRTAITQLAGCEDMKIAVHCYHGYDRARPFSHRFANAGYNSVYDIGGFKNLQSGVETGTGDWDGILPSCSALHQVRLKYIEAEVQLDGVAGLSVSAQAGFKTVLADSSGSVCGSQGTTQCTASDVSITSINQQAGRRSGHISVAFSLQAASTSADAGATALATVLASSTFATSLSAQGGDLAGVTQVSVLSAPASTYTQPEVPANPSGTSPAPPSEWSINEHGVTVVEPPTVSNNLHEFDIILDVRSPSEFQNGHIPGAINLPGGRGVQELQGCEQKKIAVYCWTGFDRATPIARKMAAAGFLYVFDLGGMQFMDGLVTERGPWDGTMPTCAAGSSEDSKGSLCWLYLLVVMVLVAVGGGALVFIKCGGGNRASQTSDAAPVGAVVATPLNVVDVEKAEAIKAFAAPLPGYSTAVPTGHEVTKVTRGCDSLACPSYPTGAPVPAAPAVGHVEAIPVPDATSKDQA